MIFCLGLGLVAFVWLVYKSKIWLIPLLPLMVAYFMVKGNPKQKAEALIVLKVLALAVVVYGFMYCLWCLFKGE